MQSEFPVQTRKFTVKSDIRELWGHLEHIVSEHKQLKQTYNVVEPIHNIRVFLF